MFKKQAQETIVNGQGTPTEVLGSADSTPVSNGLSTKKMVEKEYLRGKSIRPLGRHGRSDGKRYHSAGTHQGAGGVPAALLRYGIHQRVIILYPT